MTATNTHHASATPHVCWLGGWAVSEQAMLSIVQRLLPTMRHSVLTPTQNAVGILHRQMMQTAETTCDDTAPTIFAGYSTGAFLLLRELEQLSSLLHSQKIQLLLLAPFADFRAESELGGKVVTTRLKLLLRRLRSDPLAAVADFYQQSGIVLSPPSELPYAQDDLIWGIEQLAQTAVCPQALAMLCNGATAPCIRAWVGAKDALLDAQKIAGLFASGVCHVAQSASHDLASLLAAANTEGRLLS